MAARRTTFRNPSSFKQTLTIKVKITTASGNVKVTDLILQAGTTGTGWLPNVTEMPWTTGVVS
ncbi:hypothetical protein FDJ34_gp19 [Microbacterium phage Eleri]|uniref:Uncharacterized protein n=4 Tax=Elerivirus eleri TaxID=2560589 RepID=A0A6N0A7S4_9CAUD|nr:hypothetical protein FDJ34_gp19 [Microbacterium phage Eleri]AXH70572.1 hypothetical protein SEA_COLACORTA_19 [Microbacterium phage ColaCorta]AXH70697.1 hypothetical protein SEA_ANDROMEDAS_19 [Microbacterium phage Andromedas]QKO02647.1 hypothetical protein SEA_GLAMOUR_18 [Microbacterium phage Glamour]UDG78978.1 hypothetical protein SEA_SARATOS_19 [Microbacterium phage Saratos]AUX83357.1 hypothetical protein SEA_ELERI_19 [Microbacterium phage Eleri]